MPKNELRIGLIGLGQVCAAVHHPGLSRIPGVKIVGLCETDEMLLARRRKEWGIKAGYTDIDEFLKTVKPDAVSVSVPNVYHHDLVLKVIEAAYFQPSPDGVVERGPDDHDVRDGGVGDPILGAADAVAVADALRAGFHAGGV